MLKLRQDLEKEISQLEIEYKNSIVSIFIKKKLEEKKKELETVTAILSLCGYPPNK
jgi:hypothetical protein